MPHLEQQTSQAGAMLDTFACPAPARAHHRAPTAQTLVFVLSDTTARKAVQRLLLAQLGLFHAFLGLRTSPRVSLAMPAFIVPVTVLSFPVHLGSFVSMAVIDHHKIPPDWTRQQALS